MNKNVGSVDRVIRLLVAVAAVFGALKAPGPWNIVLWIVAVVMAVTAVVGFCPLYLPLKMSTNKRA